MLNAPPFRLQLVGEGTPAATDTPRGTRRQPRHGRECCRRVPRGVSVAAGVRLLRQAEDERVGRCGKILREAALMARLGYARYGAQGGDWGSAVTMHSARSMARFALASTSRWRWGCGRTSAIREMQRRRGRSRASNIIALNWLLQAAIDPPADARLRLDELADGRPHRSWKNSGPGRIATAIPKTFSIATSCSTM